MKTHLRSCADRVEFAREAGFPGLTLGLFVGSLIVYAFPAFQSRVELNFVAVRSGEVWRLVTGHFTHWSKGHLVWDAITFVILGAIVERRDRRAMLATIAAASIAISLGVMRLHPELKSYRGLSGIDVALFVVAAVQIGRSDPTPMKIICVAVLAGLCVKLAFETYCGVSLFVNQDAGRFTPVPLAHLIGAAVGAVVGASRPIIDRFFGQKAPACFAEFGA